MNAGFETREERKATKRLRCDKPIPTKIKPLGNGAQIAYNAKGMLINRMDKNAAMDISVLTNEMKQIEKEGELYRNQAELGDRIYVKNNQTNSNQVHDQSKLFIRNFDEGKLYTNRYVRRLKAAHQKLMDKFTLGSKYALVSQRKQIMARATRLVVDSHEKLLGTFQEEAIYLLY